MRTREEVNEAMAAELLRHLPAPALREGEHVAFRGDGSNAIIGEFYDETGLLVTHAYRIWVEAELIADGAA